MKKFFLFILVVCIVAGCGNRKAVTNSNITSDTTNQTPVGQTKTTSVDVDWETRITDTILSLPEVQERANYIEKETKGKRHLGVMISETPQENGKDYYVVKAGEDNGTNWVTHFNFIVYVPTMKITYMDPLSGEEITLDEWRKQPK
jgi:hypothetical protein